MLDVGIVCHRGKIASTINNAQRAQELCSELGSLFAYFWRLEPAPDTRPQRGQAMLQPARGHRRGLAGATRVQANAMNFGLPPNRARPHASISAV